MASAAHVADEAVRVDREVVLVEPCARRQHPAHLRVDPERLGWDLRFGHTVGSEIIKVTIILVNLV